MSCRANICFSLLRFFLLSLHCIVVISSISPFAVVFPVSKHATTRKHTITMHQRTPLAAIEVAVDLGGGFLWMTCGSDAYSSSSYESPLCNSPQCSLAQQPSSYRKKCINATACTVCSRNIFNGKIFEMKLSGDVLNLQSTNGFNPTSIVSIPTFLFLCSSSFHSKGKPFRAKGVAGLSNDPLALPSQISMKFNISRKFSVCLSPLSSGVLFFGDGPYVFSPGIDLSKVLIQTPLYFEPRKHIAHHDHHNSHDYFIKVNSLRVNGRNITFNSSLLAKISTNVPYAILKTSVYTALTRVFIDQAKIANFTRVAPKSPFNICFSTKNQQTKYGDDVIRLHMPIIDFVLQDENVFWRVFGLNSMVQMGNDTICLGIFDGGSKPKASIKIGSYFLENNLLQFDLETSTLGFTNSLLHWGTNCGSFNFTTII